MVAPGRVLSSGQGRITDLADACSDPVGTSLLGLSH
jgi:hypothetical protein